MPIQGEVHAKEAPQVQAPNAFSVYCNSTSMGITPWDIRFRVMELSEREGSVVMINHGNVVMSPLHAKAFLLAMQDTIRQYEEKFGEIDLSRLKG